MLVRHAALVALVLIAAGLPWADAKKSKIKSARKKKSSASKPPQAKAKPSPGVHAQVPPKCFACERTVAALHGVLKEKIPIEDWKAKLTELCGHTQGCDFFLDDFNLKVLASEAQDIYEDPESLPIPVTLQVQMCMDMTGSCSKGEHGKPMHKFQPLPGEGPNYSALEVKATFKSKLKSGDVRIYWLDPSKPAKALPEQPSAVLRPGGTVLQNSYATHRFRLLGPGVGWGEKQGRVDVTIADAPDEQVFEISLNKTAVDGLPETIPDPSASEPEGWDEDEDGEWQAPLVDNPDAQFNHRFVVVSVDPATGAREEL